MLVTKNVWIYPNKDSLYYKQLGYFFEKSNVKILVQIEHLLKGSSVIVDVKCDICGNFKNISYEKYNKNISNSGFYGCSFKCSKNKAINTHNKNCGYDWNSKSPVWKEKVENTNILNLGVPYPMMNKTVHQKSKNTLFKNYEVYNPSLSDIIKDKKNNTFLKYGGHPMFNEFVKKRQIDTVNRNMFLKNTDIGFEYEVLNYTESCFKIKHIKCNNIFEIKNNNFYNRKVKGNCLCTICFPIDVKSIKEKELCEWVKDLGFLTIENDRKILNGQEIDILIPELSIGIEFNGDYWHSDKFKDDNYHINKCILAEEKGIEIIHIWESEWNTNKDLVKKFLLKKFDMFW